MRGNNKRNEKKKSLYYRSVKHRVTGISKLKTFFVEQCSLFDWNAKMINIIIK